MNGDLEKSAESETKFSEFFDHFAEINARELRDALTRVGVMADDSHRRVEFIFYPGKVLLETKSSETGSSTEEVSCTFQRFGQSSDSESGESVEADWKIAFSTEYLSEFFSVQSAKRDDQRIVRKFTTGSTGQSEMLFEGEAKLLSYVLVLLKT